ncbi:uncharacterized protein LOC135084428 [Ostrinia nubilalis]|uniref:uncharacterized protein LOC135084428 n=1 Tax=Ostrinia nubilalis TaxID=29057 RepID=UPI00308264BA
MNQTFFSSLENYQVHAEPTTEARYPWIARVVHSRTQDIPHMCTAACIEERIFITAARCIYNLKVPYTTVLYLYSRLPAQAFVVPSNGSKQAFDDIGFIIVQDAYKGVWATIQLFDKTNRTDDGFKWFADLNLSYGPIEHKVVGYATEKGIHRIKAADRKFDLSELIVIVSINICNTILTFNHQIQGFHVPCYHSCNLHQFQYNDDKCKKYHGVEGGVIFDTRTNKLLGIATWGPYFRKYELPVGFAVPNSENFFDDYSCARRIRNDNGELAGISYQSLCENA